MFSLIPLRSSPVRSLNGWDFPRHGPQERANGSIRGRRFTSRHISLRWVWQEGKKPVRTVVEPPELNVQCICFICHPRWPSVDVSQLYSLVRERDGPRVMIKIVKGSRHRRHEGHPNRVGRGIKTEASRAGSAWDDPYLAEAEKGSDTPLIELWDRTGTVPNA